MFSPHKNKKFGISGVLPILIAIVVQEIAHTLPPPTANYLNKVVLLFVISLFVAYTFDNVLIATLSTFIITVIGTLFYTKLIHWLATFIDTLPEYTLAVTWFLPILIPAVINIALVVVVNLLVFKNKSDFIAEVLKKLKIKVS